MTKAPAKTRSSTPKLSEIAQHVVAPSGVTTTGWGPVERKCRDLGITFRPWQPDVGRLILAKRDDGRYAATIGGTGLSIPRQVGKTFLVGAIVFALCLLRPNLTVIWTAHRLRTAEETFGKMQKFARRKKIAPHIAKLVLGSGEEEVRFRNDSRILFGARESGFGLGFDEVDVLIFDEAQRLKDSTLDDMIPATNQSRQPTSALLLFMGTPPRPTDSGEVFTRMRTEALSGEDEDTGWVEFGADPGYEPAVAPAPLTEADWAQIARANPSYPEDTQRVAILRMRKKLGHDSFLREGMGQWDELPTGGTFFSTVSWSDLEDAAAVEPAVEAIGLASDVDHAWSSISAAGHVPGTFVPHVGVTDRRRGTGGWMVDEAARIQSVYGCRVVIDGKGPAAHLIPKLEEAGVELTIADASDVCDSSELIYQRAEDKTLRHRGYPELDRSAAAATWRPVGDRRAIGRRKSLGDVSAFEAAALALWGASQPAEEPMQPFALT